MDTTPLVEMSMTPTFGDVVRLSKTCLWASLRARYLLSGVSRQGALSGEDEEVLSHWRHQTCRGHGLARNTLRHNGRHHYVFDELSAAVAPLKLHRPTSAPQKGFLNVKLTAPGHGGHSSLAEHRLSI